MLVERMIPTGSACATFVILAFVCVPAGLCQTNSNTEEGRESSGPIDEIVVQSEKPLIVLRREMRAAEVEMFALYNSLNSDDEYDVHCAWERVPGGVFRRHVCTPNYVTYLTSDAGRRWLTGRPGVSAPALIQQKNNELREEMEKLMRERPEFLQALLKLADAKEVFESERQRRCRGRILCRR